MRVTLCVLSIVLGSTALSLGNTIVETANFSFTLPSSGESFSLPTFDDLGGTRILNFVQLDLAGSTDAHLLLTNTFTQANTWGVESSGYAHANVSPHLNAHANYSAQLPPVVVNPGTLDLGLISIPFSASDFRFSPEAYDYAGVGFLGTGLLDLSLTAAAGFGLYSGPMGALLNVDGPISVSGTATVTFDYTSQSVPEPSGFVLAALGLAGVTTRRLRKLACRPRMFS